MSQTGERELDLMGRPAWAVRERRQSTGDRLSEFAPVGILELDAAGRCHRINRALSRLTGYSADELNGHGLVEIADRSGSDEWMERLDDLRHRGAGVIRFDLGLIRKDGLPVQGRVTATTVPPEAPGGATAQPALLLVIEDASGELPDDAAAPLGARIDVVETVAAAVSRVRETAHEHGVDVAFAYAALPVWVDADEAELRETVEGLLAAAVDSADGGSVAVRCTRLDSTAELEVVALPDTDGIGVDLGALFGRDQAATASEGAEHVTVSLPLARV